MDDLATMQREIDSIFDQSYDKIVEKGGDITPTTPITGFEAAIDSIGSSRIPGVYEWRIPQMDGAPLTSTTILPVSDDEIVMVNRVTYCIYSLQVSTGVVTTLFDQPSSQNRYDGGRISSDLKYVFFTAAGTTAQKTIAVYTVATKQFDVIYVDVGLPDAWQEVNGRYYVYSSSSSSNTYGLAEITPNELGGLDAITITTESNRWNFIADLGENSEELALVSAGLTGFYIWTRSTGTLTTGASSGVFLGIALPNKNDVLFISDSSATNTSYRYRFSTKNISNKSSAGYMYGRKYFISLDKTVAGTTNYYVWMTNTGSTGTAGLYRYSSRLDTITQEISSGVQWNFEPLHMDFIMVSNPGNAILGFYISTTAGSLTKRADVGYNWIAGVVREQDSYVTSIGAAAGLYRITNTGTATVAVANWYQVRRWFRTKTGYLFSSSLSTYSGIYYLDDSSTTPTLIQSTLALMRTKEYTPFVDPYMFDNGDVIIGGSTNGIYIFREYTKGIFLLQEIISAGTDYVLVVADPEDPEVVYITGAASYTTQIGRTTNVATKSIYRFDHKSGGGVTLVTEKALVSRWTLRAGDQVYFVSMQASQLAINAKTGELADFSGGFKLIDGKIVNYQHIYDTQTSTFMKLQNNYYIVTDKQEVGRGYYLMYNNAQDIMSIVIIMAE